MRDFRIPILAIVGRPNVGKSTFFNRVSGSKLQVVEDEPGITRDRAYSYIDTYEIPFYMVDTGGIERNSTDELKDQVYKQAMSAVEEADLVLFFVDSKDGVQTADEEVLNILRTSGKPFILIANKCDGKELETLTAEFYSLGVEEVIPCSALHGRGVSEVITACLSRLDNFAELHLYFEEQEKIRKEITQNFEEKFKRGEEELVEASSWFEDIEGEKQADSYTKVEVSSRVTEFPPVFNPDEGLDYSDYEKDFSLLPLPKELDDLEYEIDEEEEDDTAIEIEEPKIETIRVAIIGRPNVGKSTLLNALLGTDRAITSAIAGTTRDSIHEKMTVNSQEFELIDTAGMRKKGRIGDVVEKYSVLRSLRAIGDCDVAVVVLAADEGPTEQDAKIVGLAHDQGKGIIIVVNKWDLASKDHTAVKDFEEKVKETFKFIPYAPMIFISAQKGRRVTRILDAAATVAIERTKRVSTTALNKLLRQNITRVQAPVVRGRQLKLFYAAQVDTSPPRFMLVFNYPKQAHFSYLRFIKNVIRDKYGFSGTDIKLVTRKRGVGSGKQMDN